jgi:hypothetical protein
MRLIQQLYSQFFIPHSSVYKMYIVTQSALKAVYNFTADLSEGRPGKKLYLLSFQLLTSEEIQMIFINTA